MNIIPLSYAQQRIWLECKRHPQSVAYNNPLLYELNGSLDVDCLTKALQHIVTEQTALRCYFITQSGLPKQVIEADCQMQLDYHDVSESLLEAKDDTIDRIIGNNIRQPFDLSKLPLFRFTLIKTDYNRYLFLLNIHHIVVDGYSAKLLIDSISNYYRDFLLEKDIPLSQIDEAYIAYIEKLLDTQQTESKGIAFWQEQFNDANLQIDLFQKDLTLEDSEEGVRHYFSVSSELTLQIKQLAKRNKTTDFIVLMTAFYVVLSKFSSQKDLTIGYPLDIRPATCRDMFGFFVNHIPMRMQISLDDTFKTLIDKMHQQRKAIKPFQHTDIMQIIRYVRMVYSHQPDSLFNTSFIRANFAMSGLELPDVRVIPKLASTGAVKEDLCLLYDEHESFEFAIEFKKNKFDERFVRQIQEAYIAYLESLLSQEETPIKDIDLHTSSGKSCYGPTYPESFDFRTIFLNHVTTLGQQVAVVTSETSLTYEALHQAVVLWRTLFLEHLSNDRPVVVCLPRTPRLLAILLALQGLEITYIPIDPTLAMERIKSIIEDSQASTILFDENDSRNFALLPCLSMPLTLSGCNIPAPLNKTTYLKNPIVYIIYTSGSTGKPKGVAISWVAFNNFLHALAGDFLQREGALMLAITTIGFDIAHLELFLPLWQNKAVFLANQEQHKDPFMLINILNQYPITHMQATPAMWQMLLEIGWNDSNRLIALCGGEALTQTLANQLLVKTAELWNMYGPTEATIWCAIKRVYPNEKITIGRPIANMEMRVLDEAHHILPPYVKGELYIGGVGLASEYVNNSLLTQSQFIACQDALQGRLYKTGDVACATSDGEFILFGRTDNQIKLNGYRIELGEIESCLKAVKGITESAVIVHNKQILAYVCLDEKTGFSQSALTDALALFLPDYMVPKRFFHMQQLPLTVSGKVDRKALPIPDEVDGESFEIPQSDCEATLLTLWEKVLTKQNLSVTQHFYSLGGHSLAATQLTFEINQQFQTALTFADILNNPTIRQQADLLEKTQPVTNNKIPYIDSLKAPLTASQRQIWFTSTLFGDKGQYNMAAIVHVCGPFDLNRFKNTFKALLERHDALRMQLELIDYEPHVSIQDKLEIVIEPLKANDKEAWSAWAAMPFDCFCAPLWRLGYYQISDTEYSLGISLYHVIADGYSVSLFFKELWAVYDTLTPYPQLPGRYIDYAYYEKNALEKDEDIQFWRNELMHCPYLHLVPDAYNENEKATQYTATLSHTIWTEVSHFCEKNNLSSSVFLTGVFGLLMHHHAKQNDFCIGLPIVNREHPDTRDMIGCFMDLIPLRMNFPQHYALVEWLQLLDTQVKTCLTHNSCSFSSILTKLNIKRDSQKAPLFPVVLNIQTDPFDCAYSQSLQVEIKPIHTLANKYDLSLDIYFSSEKITLYWDFSTHLFSQDAIKKMHSQFEILMQNLIHSENKPLNHYLCMDTLITITQNPIQSNEVLTSTYRCPQSDLQKMVALIWQKLLKVKQVGLDDNFFRLGGHSFLGGMLIAELSEKLTRAIPLELVFKASTLDDFCSEIERIAVLQKIETTALAQMPLTSNQRQLALIAKQNNKSDIHHISVLIEMDAVLDRVRLNEVFNQEIARHSVYYWYLSKEEECGLSADTIAFEIEHSSLQDKEPLDLIQSNVYHQLDIHSAPLVKATLFSGKQNALLITMHHLIGDEWSLHRLTQAVIARYFGEPFEHFGVSNWSAHLSRWTNPDVLALQYWESYLAQANPPSRVVSTGPEADDDAMKSYYQKIDASTIKACEDIAKHYDATFYQVSMALFIYFIKIITMDDEVLFATTFSRRTTYDLHNLHGYLVNLLPVRFPTNTLADFGSLIEWVKVDSRQAMLHADVDYAYLMEKGWVFSPEIVLNYQDTFEVHAVKENTPLKWHAIEGTQAKFPIVFHIKKHSDGTLDLKIDYKSSLYDDAMIASWVGIYTHLLTILPQMQAYPLEDWFSLPPRTTKDLVESNGSELMDALRLKGYEKAKHTAIDYLGNSFSYETLWAFVRQLASGLLEKTNRTHLTGEIIAIRLTNKYHYIASLLAILETGAAFLPIDYSLPHERQGYFINDSNPLLLIDEPTSNDERCCTIEHLLALSSNRSPKQSEANSAAYLIYTSGSTGLPKGVVLEQVGLFHFISALQAKLGINDTSRVLQFSSINFDASVWEIFSALFSGATLCIPDDKERRVGQSLQDYIRQHGITHTILTPAVLNTLDPSTLPSLKVVASGGESCNLHLIKSWTNYCDFYNAYGPTEATVCVAIQKCSEDIKASQIGLPLGHAKLMVATPNLKPLPQGAIGELLIGGPILAAGYLNQAELTASRFVTKDSERWYRSGDKVRQLPDGSFDYLGRLDRQIKLRGLRIELGEIEMVLSSLKGVQSAYCLVDNDKLLAYVRVEGSVSEADLFNQLSQKLPTYFLPNEIIYVESMPLLSSGKCDPSQFKKVSGCTSTINQQPRNAMEQQIHKMWSDSLRLDAIDINQNFFSLGGNSLQIMGITAAIEALWGIECPMSLFYTHGSILLMSEFISEQIDAKEQDDSFDAFLNQLSLAERELFLENLELL